MPKRRMTPARRAQIKAWQAAGVHSNLRHSVRVREFNAKSAVQTYLRYPSVSGEASAKTIRPHGKSQILYHVSSPSAIESIKKTRRFKKGRYEPGVWFTTRKGNPAEKNLEFGPGTRRPASIRLKVPIKKIGVLHRRYYQSGEEHVMLNQKNLNQFLANQRKAKRVKR